MKKILIATNILFFSTAILLLFFLKSPFLKEGNTSACMTAKCMEPLEASNGRISASTAEKLSLAYKSDDAKRFISMPGGRTDQEDASSIWFSLKTIKKFIWDIESMACETNCRDTLGIRIYYARYPKDLNSNTELSHVDPSYANRHTLFMVPTYWDRATERYIDFNPAAGCRASFDRPVLNKYSRLMIYMPSSEDQSAQNHGGLAPPPDGVNSGTFRTTTSSF